MSAACALPVVAADALLPVGRERGRAPSVAIWPALWALCAVVVATLASRLIYGLREEVREARRLGQYTLEEKLGEGGMGVVYRARHAMLRRPTAIKLLPPEKAGSAALERFEREVQLTARLSHPNTVAIFDYGRTPDGVFYYAMEYLDGADLHTLVREDGAAAARRASSTCCGRWPPRSPRRTASASSTATSSPRTSSSASAAGSRTWPRWWTSASCATSSRPRRSRAPTSSRARRSTSRPRRSRAPDRVDGRSDLYALGAVGYFLLCGQHVFGGATLVEVCAHHLHTRPVPPSERLGRPLPARARGAGARVPREGARAPPGERERLQGRLARARAGTSRGARTTRAPGGSAGASVRAGSGPRRRARLDAVGVLPRPLALTGEPRGRK